MPQRTITDTAEKTEYTVKCHCGRVTAKFLASKTSVTAWQCNCSDCIMRGNVHVIIPQADFRLDMDESIEDATTLYLWGTKTAKRRFCKTCGILPWYRPRSNPDGYGITLYCIDWGANKPNVEIKTFDGQNWEKVFQSSNISEQSKK
jgi:hypothetical protein